MVPASHNTHFHPHFSLYMAFTRYFNYVRDFFAVCRGLMVDAQLPADPDHHDRRPNQMWIRIR